MTFEFPVTRARRIIKLRGKSYLSDSANQVRKSKLIPYKLLTFNYRLENNLKQRWKNLRAALLRHIRAELRAQQSGKPLVLKPYYMLDQLQFLIPFTRVEKPSNPRYDLNVDSTTENANEEDTEDSLADEEFIKEDATVLVQDEDDNIYLTGRRTAEEEDNLEPSENEAKRMIVQDSKEIEDLQSKVLRASQPEIQQSATEIRHEDTPEWSFFHSLMPDILAMTSAQKRKMRLRFLEVVDDILSAND